MKSGIKSANIVNASTGMCKELTGKCKFTHSFEKYIYSR